MWSNGHCRDLFVVKILGIGGTVMSEYLHIVSTIHIGYQYLALIV